MLCWLTLAILLRPLLQLSLCPSGSNTNCLPCPNECQTCASSTACATCQIQFYSASASVCAVCPSSCKQCSSSSTCTSCLQPYVLVNSACNLCTIMNAASCVSTVAASACKDGYYLSSGYCNSCLLNCLKCSSAYDCSGCASGYYLNASIFTCNPCPQSCTSCNQYTPSTCQSCSEGYQLVSGSCLLANCSLSNCLYCSSSNICQRCSQYYYWDGSACVSGGSVSCQKGAKGPLPNNCINSCSAYSFVSGNISDVFRCVMYQYAYVYPVQYSQKYYYAYNALGQLNLLASAAASLIENTGEYGYPITGGLTFSTLPNYYRIVLALKYWASSSAEVRLSATTPTASQNESFLLSSSSTPVGIAYSSSVVHSYNLKITPNTTVNLVELVLRMSRCSAGCTICLNQQLCQLCDSPNFMLSYQCVSNCSGYVHFLPNMTCLSACPSGYFQTDTAGSKFCSGCLSPCLTCTNSSFCLSCLSGYYYLNSACSTSCPSGYYPQNTSSSCKSCVSPCRTCSSEETCLSCSLGYWNGSACTTACPSGQFGDDASNACLSCDSTCLTCIITASTCTSCNSSLFFYNAQCLASCPARYYPSSGACLECLPPCYSCTSSVSCLSCSFNYLLNGSCLSVCPQDYYQDQAALTCVSCPVQCLTCASIYACTSCKTGCLYSGQCPSSCPSSSFFGQVINSSCSCQQCLYPCSTCSDATSCLSCVDGYLSNTSCVVNCPSGYYGNTATGQCALCSAVFSNCLQCSAQGCLQCSANYYLLNGTCLASCPHYYYPSGLACSLCVAPCSTCSDPASCLSCVSPYSLLGTTCLIECPSGMVSQIVNSTNLCVSCLSPCLSCSVVSTNCTYCVYGFYLYNYKCLNNCSSIVPLNGYYAQAASSSCQLCAFPCVTCLSESQCLSCKIGYWSSLTLSCSQCSLGTYPSNGSCLSCPPSCTICYSATYCSACAVNYYLLLNACVGDPELCYSSGYYVAGRICYACLQPCGSCAVTASNCTSCLSGYIFFLGQCLVECPSGYYRSNSTCLNCDVQCATCVTGSAYCLSCSTGYLLLSMSASCLSSCPVGTYQSGTVCSLCQYPCLACSSEADCLSCTTGVLIGSGCYTSCLSGYFAANNSCSPCSSPCSQCSVITTNCTQCISSYWLLGNQCLISCPGGYFGESQSRQCLPCVGLCQQCSSYINCTACSSQFIFYTSSTGLGQCVSSCPAGYFLDNGTCRTCNAQCLTCDNALTCLFCTGVLVQLEGSCLSSCPGGMYIYGGLCANCSLPCLNCSDSYTCTSCLSSDLLVGGSSCLPGPNCPSGYYLLVDAPQCDKKCPAEFYNLANNTCNNVSCGDLHFMGADMYCYSSCPSGYIANSSYHCVSCSDCSGLYFSLSYKIIKDSLYLYLIYTEAPSYAFLPTLSLSPQWTVTAVNFPLWVAGPNTVEAGSSSFDGETNITFLVSTDKSIQATYLTISFQQPLLTFKNPLQKPSTTILVEGYDKYQQLPDLSIFGSLALLVALGGLAKNPYMVDFAQTLFLVGLVDCHFPFHLASFLEGTSIAHLHGLVPLKQDGAVGEGKFMYLTGTGFIANTLSNWILFFSLLLVSLLGYLVLIVLRRRMGYSRVHDNNQSSPQEQQPSCLLVQLQAVFEKYRLRGFNRFVYFNYSIVALFSLVQLANFSTSSLLNALSSVMALVALLCLIFYPFTLREDKPKYTFLYLRKLLIGGAVVLSLKDAIYAIGIISVCNLTTAILILTYKLEKYRSESRFLAGCELGQLVLQACLSFFIMIGEGNSTDAKTSICSFILIGTVILLFVYLAEAAMQLVCYSWLKCKGIELRENWVLNQQEEEETSHHSESINPSMKDQKSQKEEEAMKTEGKIIGEEGLETFLVQVKEQMQQKIREGGEGGGEKEGERDKQNRAVFWAYEESDKGELQHESLQRQPPKMLVRCVNQFSDVEVDEARL